MSSKDNDLKYIADSLQVEISDFDLLRQALTHRSFTQDEDSTYSNERLEFLGDSVLGIVISQYLYTKYPRKTEGELAKIKAVAVSEPVLAEAAVCVGLPDMVLMSAGEESSGGRARSSILADAFEAIIAVVYIDCGLEVAREFILRCLQDSLAEIEQKDFVRDFKTVLQEKTQAVCKKVPEYRIVSETGADHDKTFTVNVHLNGSMLGSGQGKSKKQAEQMAAQNALARENLEELCRLE